MTTLVNHLDYDETWCCLTQCFNLKNYTSENTSQNSKPWVTPAHAAVSKALLKEIQWGTNKQINTPLIHVWWKMQVYTPEELRAKLRFPSGPSNMSDSANASISRRRNSRQGPPRSTASSVVPLSSENLIHLLIRVIGEPSEPPYCSIKDCRTSDAELAHLQVINFVTEFSQSLTNGDVFFWPPKNKNNRSISNLHEQWLMSFVLSAKSESGSVFKGFIDQLSEKKGLLFIWH